MNKPIIWGVSAAVGLASGIGFAETLPLPTVAQQLENVNDCAQTLHQESRIGTIPPACNNYATISLDGVKLFVLQLDGSGYILENNGEVVAKLPGSEQFSEVAISQITTSSKQNRIKAVTSGIVSILAGGLTSLAILTFDLKSMSSNLSETPTS